MNDYSGRFKIYAECKQLSILTLTNKEGLLCGRSLIWKVADSVTLMDRIYVTEDFMYEKFVDYAKQQKYWYKRYYKTYDNRTEFIDHEGTYRNKTFVINTPTDFDSYPYIDTFRYGGDGFLTNRQIDGCIYEYENTNGEREENDSGIYDDITGLYIDEDNATQVDRGERRGDTTHIDNVVDVHGRNYWVGDSGITEIDGTYYLNDEVVYSDYDSCYYLIDDCVYSEHYGSHIVAWRAIKVDGDYYYESDVKLINGTYQLKQA
jgi:hypothetical protein